MSAPPPRKKRITKNHFFLAGNDRLYFKHDTDVSFRPARKKYLPPYPRKHIPSRSIVPTFLNDRKFYTYAFHLPSELLASDQEMLEDHHKRVKEATQEITELVPAILPSTTPSRAARTSTAGCAAPTTKTTSSTQSPTPTSTLSRNRPTSSSSPSSAPACRPCSSAETRRRPKLQISPPWRKTRKNALNYWI